LLLPLQCGSRLKNLALLLAAGYNPAFPGSATFLTAEVHVMEDIPAEISDGNKLWILGIEDCSATSARHSPWSGKLLATQMVIL